MLPTRPRCVLHTSAAKRTTRQSSAECEVLCMQRCLKLGMGVMIRLYAARVNRLARCVDISWPVSTRHVSYHEYLWTHGVLSSASTRLIPKSAICADTQGASGYIAFVMGGDTKYQGRIMLIWACTQV